MICRDHELSQRYGIETISFTRALNDALQQKSPAPVKETKADRKSSATTSLNRVLAVNSVCSVQRLPLPAGRNAAWVADRYATWLIEFLYPFIRVERDQTGSLKLILRLGLRRWSWALLELKYAPDRSSPERQLFYIQGGLLLSARAAPKGRFEFREVLHHRCVMTAIFDFIPALPWWIYKVTQANLHLLVMWAFKKELQRQMQRR